MVTNIRLDLDDAERERIALVVSGKKGLATRAQITKYVEDLIKTDRKPSGATKIISLFCPKCRRPIGVSVPKE